MAEAEVGESKRLEEDALGGPVFSPPLYRQRYDVVCNVVKKTGARKWVDCIEELAGVDIDVTQLESNLRMLCPLATDYLMPRERPLNIRLFEGSISCADSRLCDWDVVCCVEVIEHLHTDVLDLVPHTLFGQLQPKVVVVTTPNSEFNILFPNFQSFRHWDHKFEWTRDEFRSWADGIASEFNYSVEYSGVGEGPAGSLDKLGWCTQIAVFTRLHLDAVGMHRIGENVESYRCIKQISHPHRLHTPCTILQRFNDELTYYCRLLADIHDGTEPDEDDPEKVTDEVRIPLENLMKFGRITDLCRDLDELRCRIIETQQFHLSPDGQHVLYHHITNTKQWDDETDAIDGHQVGDQNDIENQNQTIPRIPNETTETWD